MRKLIISTILMFACTSLMAFNAQQHKIVEMIGLVNDKVDYGMYKVQFLPISQIFPSHWFPHLCNTFHLHRLSA